MNTTNKNNSTGTTSINARIRLANMALSRRFRNWPPSSSFELVSFEYGAVGSLVAVLFMCDLQNKKRPGKSVLRKFRGAIDTTYLANQALNCSFS